MTEWKSEPEDFDPWLIIYYGGGSLIAIGLVVASLYFLFGLKIPISRSSADWDFHQGNEAPGIELNPAQELTKIEANARRKLETGPLKINDAMREIVDGGWPEGDLAPSRVRETEKAHPQ